MDFHSRVSNYIFIIGLIVRDFLAERLIDRRSLFKVTKADERVVYHLFDGSTGQTEQTAAWDPLMKSCGGKTNDWRTYAAVVWEDPRHYDRGKWLDQSRLL